MEWNFFAFGYYAIADREAIAAMPHRITPLKSLSSSIRLIIQKIKLRNIHETECRSGSNSSICNNMVMNTKMVSTIRHTFIKTFFLYRSNSNVCKDILIDTNIAATLQHTFFKTFLLFIKSTSIILFWKYYPITNWR